MRPNNIRTVWNAGQCVVNGWLAIPSAFSAEVMAHCGWDSLCIDIQHGMVDYQTATTMMQAISTTAVTPIVRVPWNDPAIIMKCLDAGAYGIVCPMINSGEDALRFAKALEPLHLLWIEDMITGVALGAAALKDHGQAGRVRDHVSVGHEVAVAGGEVGRSKALARPAGDHRRHRGRGFVRHLDDGAVLGYPNVRPEVDGLRVGPSLGTEDGQGHAGGHGSAHDRRDHDQRHDGAGPAAAGRHLRR